MPHWLLVHNAIKSLPSVVCAGSGLKVSSQKEGVGGWGWGSSEDRPSRDGVPLIHVCIPKKMKPPKCRLCESAHWSNEPHVFATNKKDATNKESDATNRIAAKVEKERPALDPVCKALPDVPEVIEGGAGDKNADRTPNRRKRADYNAYQRELMRKRRAQKAGLDCASSAKTGGA